jgi:hypothetical protein
MRSPSWRGGGVICDGKDQIVLLMKFLAPSTKIQACHISVQVHALHQRISHTKSTQRSLQSTLFPMHPS